MADRTIEEIFEDWVRCVGGLGEEQDNEIKSELAELRRKADALDWLEEQQLASEIITSYIGLHRANYAKTLLKAIEAAKESE
jgi:hypothetical protein